MLHTLFAFAFVVTVVVGHVIAVMFRFYDYYYAKHYVDAVLPLMAIDVSLTNDICMYICK